MMKTQINSLVQTWLVVFCISMLMPGCQCSHTKAGNGDVEPGASVQATTYDPPTPIPGGDFVLSPQMEQNLKTNLQKFLFAQNEKDWTTYVDSYYEPMLDIYNRDTLIHMFQRAADEMGWRNMVVQHEVEKITPVVEMDSLYLVSVRARVILDVVFGDKFEGDPKSFEGTVKIKYPTAVYDEANRTFHVNEKMKFFGITKKSELDFHFLVESYFNDPKLASLIKQDVFIKLRSYE